MSDLWPPCESCGSHGFPADIQSTEVCAVGGISVEDGTIGVVRYLCFDCALTEYYRLGNERGIANTVAQHAAIISLRSDPASKSYRGADNVEDPQTIIAVLLAKHRAERPTALTSAQFADLIIRGLEIRGYKIVPETDHEG